MGQRGYSYYGSPFEAATAGLGGMLRELGYAFGCVLEEAGSTIRNLQSMSLSNLTELQHFIEHSLLKRDKFLELNFKVFDLVFLRTNHHGIVSIVFNSDIVHVFDSLLNQPSLPMKWFTGHAKTALSSLLRQG